jgi:oligopeptide/dipeptide ABC transporter ATP-binding protein
MRGGDIVTIRDLTIHLTTMDGTLKVLHGVNLDIREGEIVGLVGETGCGKSITAKMLLGILPIPPGQIIRGEVHFLGKNLLKLSKGQREEMKQRIGYIPQDPMTSLNPVFTAGQVLVDNLVWRMSNMSLLQYLYNRRLRRVKGIAEKGALELLRKVHIPDPQEMLGKYPVELSGGMRQRVLIAMALAGNPVLLVADEPTTALDVTIQKAILELLLEKITEEKLSGLYITHDLGVARVICNRTYVMYAGTVVELAETRVLLDNPLHPYTKGLVHSIPKLSGESFEGIPGTVPDYFNPPRGCRFYPRCDKRMEDCDREEPPFRGVQEGHFVACKLFEQR